MAIPLDEMNEIDQAKMMDLIARQEEQRQLELQRQQEIEAAADEKIRQRTREMLLGGDPGTLPAGTLEPQPVQQPGNLESGGANIGQGPSMLQQAQNPELNNLRQQYIKYMSDHLNSPLPTYERMNPGGSLLGGMFMDMARIVGGGQPQGLGPQAYYQARSYNNKLTQQEETDALNRQKAIRDFFEGYDTTNIGDNTIGGPQKLKNGNLGVVVQRVNGNIEVADTGVPFNPAGVKIGKYGDVPVAINPDGSLIPLQGLLGDLITQQQASASEAERQKSAGIEQAQIDLKRASDIKADLSNLKTKRASFADALKQFEAGKFNTGYIASKFPNFTSAANELDSIIVGLTIDAINSATFGSLSDPERQFLMKEVISDEYTEEANMANLKRKIDILDKVIPGLQEEVNSIYGRYTNTQDRSIPVETGKEEGITLERPKGWEDY